MREKNPSMEFANKTALAYSAVCKPLCQELGLPQTAFDILLFLANNPAYNTARDIVQVRHLKANLVSIHLDRLEEEGDLVRTAVAGDRRKRALRLTEKADPIVTAGKALQQSFFSKLEENIDADSMAVFLRTLEIMNQNMDRLLEEKN